ncbi:MAG: SPASM domain-containing protein [Microscillaceae bacterium]|nr:SPASM domain-containing protein [Microscillaceae bacterium]MDW8461627.1 SPASM domain-containing protein [Cytophagales bacterium]
MILENIIPLQLQETTQVPENYDCLFLNRELWISAVGKISLCCAPDELRDTLVGFGNIQTYTLQEVLLSENYQNLVKNYKQISLCQTCNMRK